MQREAMTSLKSLRDSKLKFTNGFGGCIQAHPTDNLAIEIL